MPRSAATGRTLAAGTFRLGCWMGLAAGLAETVGHGAQYRFLHRILPGVLHPHAPWMTLAADLLVFVVPAALLSLAVWCWPRAGLARLASALYAVLLLYAWAISSSSSRGPPPWHWPWGWQ